MAYEEYRGFFHIGMVERNEHNAIIQHGTMTIVAKDALEEVDGWSEWCITEDTELGLKLFEAGYEAAYVPQSMGSGLMPDTLEAFMTQRYRWVYGAMQMLKRHAKAMFAGASALSWPQRYQFLSGWLPWISDGLGMVVTLMAIVWTVLMWVLPSMIDVPMPALSAAAMALFATKLLKTLLLYPPKVGSGVRGAFVASVAGLSLTHTVGKAVWTGLFTSGQAVPAHAKMRRPRQLQPSLARGVAGSGAVDLAADGDGLDGFRPRLPGSGGLHVDGDAGGAEPALSCHHGDRTNLGPFQPNPGRAGAGRGQAVSGGLIS
jgi:hypothetical protein